MGPPEHRAEVTSAPVVCPIASVGPGHPDDRHLGDTMSKLTHRTPLRSIGVACCLALVCSVLVGLDATAASAKGTGPKVLYVGSLSGHPTPPSSTFSSIQSAVDASKPGDWILIAPGDYHESGDMGADAPSPSDLADGWYGGVDISTPRIHLRGMNRNSVIVDGTTSAATTPCSASPADQNTLGGEGRNGILVWKVSGVSVDNLTVCNFLAGSGTPVTRSGGTARTASVPRVCGATRGAI